MNFGFMNETHFDRKITVYKITAATTEQRSL